MALTDLVELSTTVTAQSGATVTLASVAGLEVGDKIIIESDHGYDETGLDGDWAISNLGDFAGGGHYYLDVTHIGKSFISGAITNITSNVVTVDRVVPSGAVGLPCYRNNFDAVVNTIDNYLPWPTGKRFAVASSSSAPMRCYMTDTYAEIDFGNCELFSPRGCGPVGLRIGRLGGGAVSNKRYKNLTFRGNAKTSGYCFNVETGAYSFNGSSQAPAFAIYGTGGFEGNATNNVIVENFTFIDNWRAMEISIALDCFAVNCQSTCTDKQMNYVQWEFLTVASRRCAFIDCTYDGDYMRPGFEPFQSIGCSYIRCGGRNTSMGSNSSGSCLFKDCFIVIDDTDPAPGFSPDNFLLNINRIIETQQGTPTVGTDGGIGVINFRIRYDAIPYPTDGVSGEIWKQVGITPGDQGIDVGADIRGIDFQVVRTNVTQNNGYTDGYVVNNNVGAVDTYLSGVTGDSLDSGTKLLNVTEV